MYCKWIRIDLLFGNTSVHNGHFEVVNDVSDFVKYFFSNDSDTFTSLIFRFFCFKWLFCRWIQMSSLLGKTSLHIWHCSGIAVFFVKNTMPLHNYSSKRARENWVAYTYTQSLNFQLTAHCWLLSPKSLLFSFLRDILFWSLQKLIVTSNDVGNVGRSVPELFNKRRGT